MTELSATQQAWAAPPRPECDGGPRHGIGGCGRLAVWQVKLNDGEEHDWVWGACAHHLSQISTYLVNGEQGELIVRRTTTVER